MRLNYLITGLFFATIAALGVGLGVAPASAHGIMVPSDRALPPLGLAHHRVEIAIDSGLATVTIDQSWRNSTARPLEATYYFPVPKGGVVTGFELEINGKMQKGEMLERDKARRIYQDIVARIKDPGLVEWMDRDLFQVRIFPVPARGEQRLRLKYAQPLETLAGTYRLVYPLRTAKQVARTLDDFTLTTRIRDTVPVGTVYSPTHKIAVAHRDKQVVIGFEQERVTLDKDFVLYFGVSTQAVGMSTIVHRRPGEPGYFLLTAAPREELESKEVQGKAIVFVLDTSGSMTGDKIQQAKAALRYCIERLGSDDRFEVMRFSSDVERLSSSGLIAASDANKRRALGFVDEFEAAGGTAIDEALRAALKTVAGERSALVLFVTDGRPTVGEVDASTILKATERANHGNARIFTMGVGEDLDTHLVDLVAGKHGGTSHYVRPGEDVKRAISALYEHIAYPVLTDVSLTITGGDVRAYGVLPTRMPDLFRGQQLLVAGRYRGHGKTKVRLEGRLGDETRRFEISVDFPEEEEEQDFVASVWAHRQVGYLLDQVRLNGETAELREEIIQLAKQYGIVTPYTSWLVVDDSEIVRRPPRPGPHPPPVPIPRPRPVPPPWIEGNLGGGVRSTPMAEAPADAPPSLDRDAEEQERIVLETARPKSGRSEDFRRDGGKAGVDAAETVKILKDKADDAPVVRTIKRVGGRVFGWTGDAWVDQAITPGLERVQVKLYSKEWVALAGRGEDVRAALALGERVQVRIGDTVFVIT